MKTITIRILAALIIMTMFSCAKILSVHDDNKKVKGIPFFIKKQIIQQETRYLYWWYEISLVKVEKEGDKVTEEEIIKKSVVASTEQRVLDELIKKVSDFTDSNEALKKEIKAMVEGLTAAADPFRQVSASNVNLISNTWQAATIVDYEHPYYLNGVLPWFGTGSFTQKLNADGTLGEASAEADTKLGDFITSILPIKELLSAKLIPETEAAGILPVDKSGKEKLKLVIRQRGQIYIFNATHCACGLCDDDKCARGKESTTLTFLPPIPFDHKKGRFTIQSWDPTVAADETTGESKPAIKVSGTIQLPEKEK